MQHALTASLIDHLREKTDLPVVWVYDGVSLPKVKPFLTVEQLPSTDTVIAKLRETARTIYRYQIGFHANTASERARRQDEIKHTLVFDEIKLLDTAHAPAPVVGSFFVQVTAVTPVTPENINDLTNYHKVYFDVEVDQTYRRRG